MFLIGSISTLVAVAALWYAYTQRGKLKASLSKVAADAEAKVKAKL